MEKEYEDISKIVEKEFSEDTSHTMDHVLRVYNTALNIAKEDKEVDLHVLKLAVLLHDIAKVKEDKDDTGNTDHALLGAELAEKVLRDLNYKEEVINKVKNCIRTHRYRGGILPESKEAKILFDADKLDILGSIGIARSYIIAGEYHQQIYSPIKIEEYIRENVVGKEITGRIKNIKKHAPNLEYEMKIRNIPGKLFTDKAKQLATKRIAIMDRFFKELKEEIKANS